LHRLIWNSIKKWRLSRYTLLQRIKEIYQAQLVIFKKNWKKCSFSRNGQSPITQRLLQLGPHNFIYIIITMWTSSMQNMEAVFLNGVGNFLATMLKLDFTWISMGILLDFQWLAISMTIFSNCSDCHETFHKLFITHYCKESKRFTKHNSLFLRKTGKNAVFHETVKVP